MAVLLGVIMPGAREIRLKSDYEHLQALADRSKGMLILEKTSGDPPDEYELCYHCRSITHLDEKGKPVYADVHRVHIRLPARYPLPSAPPVVQMRTPLFHPHVYPNRVVCLGAWQTGEFLDELALRLGAMIQFDRRGLNVLDPANEQAVSWAQKNLYLFPTDTRNFLGDDTPNTLQNPNTPQTPTRPKDPDAPLSWVELMD